MDPISADLELSPELLELGEVAGLLRPRQTDQDGMVVGRRADDAATLLVVEADWFSDPLGDKGLGGIPDRLDALFRLLETVGILGAPESETGEGEEAEQTSTGTVVWYPILDPSSSLEDTDTEHTDAEETLKKTGIYLVHESKGDGDQSDETTSNGSTSDVVGIGFRHAVSNNGVSLEPSAVLPLFHFNETADFVVGSRDYPLKLGVKIADPDGKLESHDFKIGSFEVAAELSESPTIDFGFKGLGLPNMPDPHFPGATNDGELDLNALKAIPDNGEAWLNFVFDLLVAQLDESGQVTVANLRYLLGLPNSDPSVPQPIPQPEWSDLFGDHPGAAGSAWLREITSNEAVLSHWLHGWFCLFQGIDVNEHPQPEDESASIALIDLPGIAKLDLTVMEKENVITPGLELESPVFQPASGIGVQLSAKTDIVELNLAPGSIKAEHYFPSFEVMLSVRHPEEDGTSVPLFSYRDDTGPDNNVTLGSVELGLSLSADGIAARLDAKGLSLGSEPATNRSLAELFSPASGEGDLIAGVVAEAVKKAYANYLPVPESSASDFVEKYINLRDYSQFLRVIIDFAGVEVPKVEDPFPAVIDQLADGLTTWAGDGADVIKLHEKALQWIIERIKAGGLTKALGDVLGSHYAGISVEGNLMRFAPLDAVSLALGVNEDNLFGVWIEPTISISADWLTFHLAGGVGFGFNSKEGAFEDPQHPQFSLSTRVSADATALSLPGVSALPELAGELMGNGDSFSLKLYPQGKAGDGGGAHDGDADDGIEFLPKLESDWLEQLAVQLVLPMATDIALNNASVQEILMEAFPGTEDDQEINLRAVLVEAKLLTKEADALRLNSIGTIKKLKPEGFLKAAFAVLTRADRFTIAKGSWGGFAVVLEDGLYGIQAQIEDLAITKPSPDKASNSPTSTLQIGKWLAGKDQDKNWIQAASEEGDNAPDDASGLSLYLVATDGSFQPKIELTSVGLDIEGTPSKPLFNLKGYRLQGLQSRLYFSWAKDHGAPKLGAALQVKGLGIPLGPPAGNGGGGNPVAQNLISSGNGSADAEPINPTFSATVGYKDKLWGEIEGDQSSDGKVWLAVRRAFGPLFCRRIGFGFEPDETRFLVGYDGKVAVGPLGLDLVDLSVGIPLKSPTEIENYSLDLEGIDISFDQEPLAISGGLFESEDPETGLTEYAGSAVISAKALTISGFGVFGSVDGDVSFFLFGMLDKDLGGPAFFHVTGLAAGFGYNRGLKLPALEEVEEFPLVKGVLEPGYFGGSDDPKEALVLLRDYLPARRGAYWFAAGVRFTSFEMIESVAVLSLAFGSQTVISVLGVSTLTIPKGVEKKDAVAYARLLLKAEFAPSAGTLKVEGSLTDDSFIFSKNCRLTGGFAFYTWFAGSHEGDFVITIGGYHPRFDPPTHYPQVRRVGIDWAISSDLRVTGELYFALTPSCLMAGGALAARFESGGLKAWFDAYAHFIMYWEPFYYQIDIGVRIGASYTFSVDLLFTTIRITLEIELSAQLSLWGPPFAGRAHLSYGPLDFTLTFGPQTKAVLALGWSDFKDRMLPTQPISIEVTSGMLRQDRVEITAGAEKVLWPVVNAHQLRVTTRSAVPSTEMRLNGPKVADSKPVGAIGIWPMERPELNSSFHIEVREYGAASPLSNTDASFTTAVLRQGVPYAMWSPEPWSELKPSADVIEGVPTGLRFGLENREPTHELPAVKLKKLQYEEITKRIGWSEIREAPPIKAWGDKTLMGTIWNNDDVNQKRQAVLDVLQRVTPFQLNQIDLEVLSKTADDVFQEMPPMGNLGQPYG